MLHKALKLIRIYHNLSQKSLAEKLEMSTSHICDVENGKKSPSLEMLGKYSKFFNIPLSSIMLFSEHIAEDGKVLNKARTFIADKILKILAWIADIK
jgi:transcriptional regulator with XRE-family HTH domain